jgi:hypothetical protein
MHTSRGLCSFLVALGTVILGTSPASGLGAGAPPVVSFAGIFVQTATTNHFPGPTDNVAQLFATLDVQVPGGSVLLNVASVVVTLPDNTTSFPLFKDTNDLFPEISFFRNLTEAGLVGAPPGTYTFTVTDTAGGVTTVTDDLGTLPTILPTASISLSGAQQVGPVGGQILVLDSTTNPTPTVTWTAVAGAVSQRVRVRPFTGPDLFSRGFADGSTTSTTLSPGVLVPGRMYNLLVEAEDGNFLPNTNVRVRRTVRVYTQGPDIILSSTGSAITGQTLTINARVLNEGSPVTADVSIWIGVPGGLIATIFQQDNVTIPAGIDASFPIFSRTWDGTEPVGNYVVGIRLTDPTVRETIVSQTRTYSR